MGLQHGVPLATFVRKFANMKFEPAGITDDAELRIATSLIDYIFTPAGARLPLGRGPRRARDPLDAGAHPADAARRGGDVDAVDGPGRRRAERGSRPAVGPAASPTPRPMARAEQLDAPLCYSCGNTMQRAGSCYVCGSCGSTSGCS